MLSFDDLFSFFSMLLSTLLAKKKYFSRRFAPLLPTLASQELRPQASLATASATLMWAVALLRGIQLPTEQATARVAKDMNFSKSLHRFIGFS